MKPINHSLCYHYHRFQQKKVQNPNEIKTQKIQKNVMVEKNVQLYSILLDV